MKTTKLIKGGLLAAIMLLSIAGCNKDTVCLKGRISPLHKSKVYVSSDNYSCWNNRDQLNVNGSQKNVHIDDTNAVTIADVSSSSTGYFASYPYNNTRSLYYTDGSVGGTMTLPETQLYTLDEHNKQVIDLPLIAYAATADDVLQFHSAAALMKIDIKNEESSPLTINRIEIKSATTGILLSGNGHITSATNISTDPKVVLDNGSNRTMLTFNDPVTIPSGTTGNNKIFYLVVPEVECKLTIEIHGQVGSTYMKFTKTQTNAITILRNQLVPVPQMGTSEFESEVEGTYDHPFEIPDSATWVSYVTNVNGGIDYAGTYFKITNNFRLTNAVPMGTSDNPFSGNINGDGKTITVSGMNNATNMGLIGYLESGSISNLNLNVNVDMTTASSVDSYGGLCGTAVRSSSFNNCIVTGTATIRSNSAYPFFGGVVGHLGISGTTNKLTNSSSLSIFVTSEERGVSCFIGGIAGKGKGLIKNCANTGVIFAQSIGYITIGGIIGNLESGSTHNSYNSGAISANDYVGGICGASNGNVENCYNRGSLSGNPAYGIICDPKSDVSISSCYYLENCGATGAVRNMTGTNCATFDGSGNLNSPATGTLSNALNTWVNSNGNSYMNWTNSYPPDFDYSKK